MICLIKALKQWESLNYSLKAARLSSLYGKTENASAGLFILSSPVYTGFVFSVCLAGFLTMTVDETNSYLVTGDADGVIKVWDISEYCLGHMADNDSPPRKYHFHSKIRNKKKWSTVGKNFVGYKAIA